MERNKSVDSIYFTTKKVKADSLIDYLDLGMFNEYQVDLIVKRGLFKKDYVTHKFVTSEEFVSFIRTNSDLIICAMVSTFKNDDTILNILVK